MNREQLLTMLARLITEEYITAREAAAVVSAFDDGRITAEDLPPVPSGFALNLPAEVDDQWGRREAQQRSDEFQEGAVGLVGASALLPWYNRFKELLLSSMLTQGLGGLGPNVPPRRIEADLRAQFTEQLGYLRRFAEQRAVRAALDPVEESEHTVMSETYVSWRSALYAGAVYGGYWLGRSERERRDGVIVLYRSYDDKNTCLSCLEAESRGPYRIDGGYPTPGLVCRGLGNCRCWLDYSYDPNLYERLL